MTRTSDLAPVVLASRRAGVIVGSMTIRAASDWEAEITSWAMRLRAGGRRPATIGLRTAHLRMLGVWAAPRGPWALGTDDLLAWTASKDWAPSTRRSVRSSLRGFYTWGLTVRRIADNPSTDLPSIRPPKPMPRPCDENVLAAAVQAAPEREVLMMRLACEVGLRRGEIAQVHTNDLHPLLLGYGLVVHGKGGKTRDVGIPPGSTLGPHLARRARENPGYLFPGQIDGHLSAAWVGRTVRRWLSGPWTMHTLRHYFATVTYAETKDLLAVQQQLGHASPATTQNYVAMPLDDLQALADVAARRVAGLFTRPVGRSA